MEPSSPVVAGRKRRWLERQHHPNNHITASADVSPADSGHAYASCDGGRGLNDTLDHHCRKFRTRAGHRCSNRRRVFAMSLLFCGLTATTLATRVQHAFISPPMAARRGRHTIDSNIRASLYVATKHHSTMGRDSIHSKFHSNEDGDDLDPHRPLSVEPVRLHEKLTSFASNINRLRSKRREARTKQARKRESDDIINACSSLIHFMSDETTKLSSSRLDVSWNDAAIESIRGVLESSLIQSTRALSEVGDFVLISKLAHSAGDYAAALAGKTGVSTGFIPPRVFGEAIASLSKTKASISKIKSLWNYFTLDVAPANPAVLSSGPGVYEMNAMLTSLADRGKVSAALKLYRLMSAADVNGLRIRGDAYTASILFGMLADSISAGSFRQKNQEAVNASPCWQWNEAIALLDTFEQTQLNNYAYAALVKVNERATVVYGDDSNQRHNGVSSAMAILERMREHGISPDVITCSALLSTFDKGRSWRASVTLLDAMAASNNTDTSKSNTWSLPLPNMFTYSLAISTCARCNQGDLAMSLLDKMSKCDVDSDDCVVSEPNTWVYNAALLSCTESSVSPDSKRLATALGILESMEASGNDGVAEPDSVTYNTVLSVIDSSSFQALQESRVKLTRYAIHGNQTGLVDGILQSMADRGVVRDEITYRNAIAACGTNSEAALALLSRSFEDVGHSASLDGRAASGPIFVGNSALSVASKTGDIYASYNIIAALSERNVKLDNESMQHVIRTLGKIGDCEAILALLICLRGQEFANNIMIERYNLDILANIDAGSLPLIDERVYSVAITSCLKHDQLGAADQILSSMKKNGLSLNQRSLKEIIAEYCRMAMACSKEEFKIARLARRTEPGNAQFGLLEPIYITSRARAKAALTMLRAVDNPSPGLLSLIAKACCAAGLWQEARSILRRMHRAAILELRRGQNLLSTSRVAGNFLNELPRLHRSLLKFCARSGSITPALNFADDIQYLASSIREHSRSAGKEDGVETEIVTLSSRLMGNAHTPDHAPETDFSNTGAMSSLLKRPVGLTGQDWKLILIAASRGGHWKVCVGTLPFIRPYVKETHPRYAQENAKNLSPSSRPSLARLNKKYDRIARALTAAILCLEDRSQYAWAIRSIDDWIEWSGRRPRKEAVASACRVLAKRFRGQEVLNLVSKVMSIPLVGDFEEKTPEYTYEKAIYTEAINALHKSGLYEEADQLYAEGATNGHLPWSVMRNSDSNRLYLDLHGMSAAVAHAGVRVALQKEIATAPNDAEVLGRDVMIVTGLGRRSGERFRPVLRPEVQRMLTEEFFPPIGTSSVPGNMGALLIPKSDIEAWLEHQRKQRGERLMLVADVLKDISTGNRLERALLNSEKRIERALKFKLKTEGCENTDDSGSQ